MNPSTATRMVDRLETAGLVSRKVNPASRRELVVELTTNGIASVGEVIRRRRHEIAQIVARMPAETRQGLVRALTAFTDAGDEAPVDSRTDLLWK